MNPKFCPFCGEGNSIVGCYQDDLGYWKVGCGACGSHSGTRPKSDPDGRAKVIANWNKAADAINRCSELSREGDDNPVEVWNGEKKVTIYRNEVIRVWGPHMEDQMSVDMRDLETVQAALDWLYDPNHPVVSSPSTEGGNG